MDTNDESVGDFVARMMVEGQMEEPSTTTTDVENEPPPEMTHNNPQVEALPQTLEQSTPGMDAKDESVGDFVARMMAEGQMEETAPHPSEQQLPEQPSPTTTDLENGPSPELTDNNPQGEALTEPLEQATPEGPQQQPLPSEPQTSPPLPGSELAAMRSVTHEEDVQNNNHEEYQTMPGPVGEAMEALTVLQQQELSNEQQHMVSPPGNQMTNGASEVSVNASMLPQQQDLSNAVSPQQATDQSYSYDNDQPQNQPESNPMQNSQATGNEPSLQQLPPEQMGDYSSEQQQEQQQQMDNYPIQQSQELPQEQMGDYSSEHQEQQQQIDNFSIQQAQAPMESNDGLPIAHQQQQSFDPNANFNLPQGNFTHSNPDHQQQPYDPNMTNMGQDMLASPPDPPPQQQQPYDPNSSMNSNIMPGEKMTNQHFEPQPQHAQQQLAESNPLGTASQMNMPGDMQQSFASHAALAEPGRQSQPPGMNESSSSSAEMGKPNLMPLQQHAGHVNGQHWSASSNMQTPTAMQAIMNGYHNQQQQQQLPPEPVSNMHNSGSQVHTEPSATEDSKIASVSPSMNGTLSQSLNGHGANGAFGARTLSPAGPKTEPVIELLESDDEGDEMTSDETKKEIAKGDEPNAKRQRLDAALEASKVRSLPQWMNNKPPWMKPKFPVPPTASARIPVGASIGRSLDSPAIAKTLETLYRPNVPSSNEDETRVHHLPSAYEPHYVRMKEGFVSSWDRLYPETPIPRMHNQANPNQEKRYLLSLLNCREFTIEGLPLRYEGPPTSVMGLRVPIKKISRDHGGATFERDKEGGGGKWRIPLAAYQAFITYLGQDPNTQVQGIPDHQLHIASLERVRQEKGYPTVDEIVKLGVPVGLAGALAPFQRGGVDFVVAKNGRALIADDMGLGKTIQGIASMSVYMQEWPVLVLSPSSARYHWESEFLRFLGIESSVNADPDIPKENLLHRSQVHVLTSSKGEILPRANTKVVICSYGLAPALVESGRLRLGQFGCSIVDESHMLKNKMTKRTALLGPILQDTKRCVLLSGTPALARPAELWPQLTILGTEQHGWWETERDFLDKYVKRATTRTRAELHALLTGTVMIRRLKSDILKTMKPKIRHKTELQVVKSENRKEFKELLELLRQGKGELAKIANTQPTSTDEHATEEGDEGDKSLNQQPHDAPPLQHGATAEGGQQSAPEAEEGEERSKRSVLSRLYSLTGDVKIPWIVQMLKLWLDDPTKGKVCIFAHHINVLDSIRDLAQLSNDPKSQRKYIRIDGSTSPKVRQDQINAFQNDPSIRVSLLGITAAGVAVTLTAASTVWFTELFWTPAIMIQAEDRCHRIGQQGQVKCVYFVGKGTLDEVLWKLIEKKFRQIGEFVEGKEKEKLVVHKVYKSAKEFQEQFDSTEDLAAETEADLSNEEEENLGFDPTNLEHDIEAFADEELQQLKKLDSDEEEEAEGSNGGGGAKPAAAESSNKLGGSQEAAITLSDDESEGEEEPENPAKFDIFKSPLKECRMYHVAFPFKEMGLSISLFGGRPVVTGLSESRKRHFGADSKPAVGDVLVMIQNKPIPIGTSPDWHRRVMGYIQKVLEPQQRSIFHFVEHKEIRAFVLDWVSRHSPHRSPRQSLAPSQAVAAAPSKPSAPDVIEID